MVALNNQPNFVNDEFVTAAEERIVKAERDTADSIKRIQDKVCARTGLCEQDLCVEEK